MNSIIIVRPAKGKKLKVYIDNIDSFWFSEEDKRILEAMKNPQKGYGKN